MTLFSKHVGLDGPMTLDKQGLIGLNGLCTSRCSVELSIKLKWSNRVAKARFSASHASNLCTDHSWSRLYLPLSRDVFHLLVPTDTLRSLLTFQITFFFLPRLFNPQFVLYLLSLNLFLLCPLFTSLHRQQHRQATLL